MLKRVPSRPEMLGSSPSMTELNQRALRRDSMLSASIRAEKAIAA
jgi:hypothetical protein